MLDIIEEIRKQLENKTKQDGLTTGKVRAVSSSVFNYLMKNKAEMPRVSFRYALEKFDKEKKLILMGD